MRIERLFPLLILVAGAIFFGLVYSKKTRLVEVPQEFKGNVAVELLHKHQCVTCHTITIVPTARGVLGPGLDDVGLRSLEFDQKDKGRNYIRESILYPDKVVRSGFVNAMPSFDGKLNEKELDLLVNWLLDLRGGQQDGIKARASQGD